MLSINTLPSDLAPLGREILPPLKPSLSARAEAIRTAAWYGAVESLGVRQACLAIIAATPPGQPVPLTITLGAHARPGDSAPIPTPDPRFQSRLLLAQLAADAITAGAEHSWATGYKAIDDESMWLENRGYPLGKVIAPSIGALRLIDDWQLIIPGDERVRVLNAAGVLAVRLASFNKRGYPEYHGYVAPTSAIEAIPVFEGQYRADRASIKARIAAGRRSVRLAV